MSGMEILLKSLGINTADLQEQFKIGYAKYQETMKMFLDTSARIEKSQRRVEQKLDLLLIKSGYDLDAVEKNLEAFEAARALPQPSVN